MSVSGSSTGGFTDPHQCTENRCEDTIIARKQKLRVEVDVSGRSIRIGKTAVYRGRTIQKSNRLIIPEDAAINLAVKLKSTAGPLPVFPDNRTLSDNPVAVIKSKCLQLLDCTDTMLDNNSMASGCRSAICRCVACNGQDSTRPALKPAARISAVLFRIMQDG